MCHLALLVMHSSDAHFCSPLSFYQEASTVDCAEEFLSRPLNTAEAVYIMRITRAAVSNDIQRQLAQ